MPDAELYPVATLAFLAFMLIAWHMKDDNPTMKARIVLSVILGALIVTSTLRVFVHHVANATSFKTIPFWFDGVMLFFLPAVLGSVVILVVALRRGDDPVFDEAMTTAEPPDEPTRAGSSESGAAASAEETTP